MLSTIQYFYDKGLNDEKVLLGAKVVWTEDEKLRNKEIYVGLEFQLEDIVNNSVNAKALGIENIDRFKELYDRFSAKGIVYFPQTESYAFLHNDDQVVNWINHDSVSSLLEQALIPYKDLPLEQMINNEQQRSSGR